MTDIVGTERRKAKKQSDTRLQTAFALPSAHKSATAKETVNASDARIRVCPKAVQNSPSVKSDARETKVSDGEGRIRSTRIASEAIHHNSKMPSAVQIGMSCIAIFFIYGAL